MSGSGDGGPNMGAPKDVISAIKNFAGKPGTKVKVKIKTPLGKPGKLSK
jgi:hypothetical protein